MEYAYQIGELIAGIIMHQASQREPLNSLDLTQKLSEQTGASPEKTITAALSNVYKRNRDIHRRKIKIDRLPQKVYHYWYDPRNPRTVDLGATLRPRRRSPMLQRTPPAPPASPAQPKRDAVGAFWDEHAPKATPWQDHHLVINFEHGPTVVAECIDLEHAKSVAKQSATEKPGTAFIVCVAVASYKSQGLSEWVKPAA